MAANPEWSNLPEWKGAKLIVAIPSNSNDIKANTALALLALQARHGSKIGFDLQVGNPVGRARNVLATRFMNSKAEWHFMLDGDMLPPIARRALYADVWGGPADGDFADMDVISRLMSQKKPLIGGIYVGKSDHGHAQFAEAYQSEAVNRQAHTGPRDECRPTDWVAWGAVLIHRSTYQAIADNKPELCPKRPGDVYRFYSMEDWEGEDVLFCQRAREAGVQPWVDYGCPCGHQGDHTFWPHNTSVFQAENKK